MPSFAKLCALCVLCGFKDATLSDSRLLWNRKGRKERKVAQRWFPLISYFCHHHESTQEIPCNSSTSLCQWTKTYWPPCRRLSSGRYLCSLPACAEKRRGLCKWKR